MEGGPRTVTDTAGLGVDWPEHPLARLNALLQVDDSKVALIKDLIQQTEQQRERIARLELQLEDERDSKDKLWGRFLECSKVAEKAGSHPYVVLLIDGDGMIFPDDYLLAPNGGQNAAAALLQHTRDLINNSGLCTPLDTFEIVIRVFGNVDGLSETLDHFTGLARNFREFTLGFSQSKSLVDFVDVGRGKEMADSKISGELRFHLSNYHCKHVILGASHDNGYARILGSLVVEGVDCNRIILLEGVPFGREFKNLPFKRVKFPNLFRSQPTQNAALRRQQLLKNNGTQAESRALPVTPVPSGQAQRKEQEDLQGINMPPPPPYQPVFQANLQPLLPIPQIPRQTIYPLPIPRPPVAMLHRVGAMKPAPCYAHYLSTIPGVKKGCSSSQCPHSHVAILSPAELLALGFLAQGMRCHSGLACNRPYCFYGHQCQVVGVCTGKQCVFRPEEHAPGTYKPEASPAPDPEVSVPVDRPQTPSKGKKKWLKKREKAAARASASNSTETVGNSEPVN